MRLSAKLKLLDFGFSAVAVKCSVFSDITPCSLSNINRRLERKYRLRLKDQIVMKQDYCMKQGASRALVQHKQRSYLVYLSE
jgi:hypothetical protein